MFKMNGFVAGKILSRGAVLLAGIFAFATIARADTTNSNDLLLDLLVKKGYVTQNEAEQLKGESEGIQTNNQSFPKWIIGNGIKSVELFGDIRFRFEDRTSRTLVGTGVSLDRYRYALRVGMRGDLAQNFYYGLRLETASNPRSPWVTFGTSSSGTPYQGPFGKSTAGINIGQIYLGWRPSENFDFTVGKMSMPLYTTPMVWDSDINPEGLVEHFKYNIGPAQFFANFGQFIYQDGSPSSASPLLLGANDPGASGNPPFLVALQGGVNYDLSKNISFKAGATLYEYLGHGTTNGVNTNTPGFSGIFVGAGAGNLAGFGTGASGFPSGSAGVNNDGFYYNQTGVNNLLILEIPFEVNFRVLDLRLKVFGDWAENFDGDQRAAAATAAAANPLIYINTLKIPDERGQDKAYQFGLAVGNGDRLGQVYGSGLKKGDWEMRVYWQHVDQYALDPNLIDSDFFEGAANLEGFYAAFAYSFSDAIVGTVRYGYASIIDKKLGTASTDQDIPQINPIDQYQLLQADLSYEF